MSLFVTNGDTNIIFSRSTNKCTSVTNINGSNNRTSNGNNNDANTGANSCTRK